LPVLEEFSMSDFRRSAPSVPARGLRSPSVWRLATQLVGCGKKAAVDEELAAKLTQPVARSRWRLRRPLLRAAARARRSTLPCVAPVTTAVLPVRRRRATRRLGPRLAQGYDGLVKSAAAGKNAMPPKGGAADLTDDELKRVWPSWPTRRAPASRRRTESGSVPGGCGCAGMEGAK
jgi:cytochrome c5